MNNPFRNNPAPLHDRQYESRDKVFKSGKSNRGGRFNGGRGRGKGRGGYAHGGRKKNYELKEKEWGKVKFNPVSPSPIVEPATPWKKFKNEIVQNEKAAVASLDLDETTSAAKAFCKKREENYRKTQILEKQKEPTQWESFGNDKVVIDNSKNKVQKKENKTDKKPFIANEVLENFNSENLTFAQRNHLRKVITKTTIISKGASLKHAVNNIKKEKAKRKHKKPNH